MIIILALCAVALIIYQPDANKVNSFISFAATITSLVLAVIAIFYSMIANQGFTSTLGSLQRSSENVETAAKNISQTSGALSGQSDRLLNELTQLSPTVMGMAAKIELLSPSADVPDAKDRRTGKSKPISDAAWTSGTIIVLYLVARSHLEKKSFAPRVVFSGRTNWIEYTNGFLDLLYSFPSMGVEISRSRRKDGEIGWTYEIDSVGTLRIHDFIERATSSKMRPVQDLKPIVDAYFAAVESTE